MNRSFRTSWFLASVAVSGFAVSCTPPADDEEVVPTDVGIEVIAEDGLTTTEAGGTATFRVVLTAQPSADVQVPLSSSNTAEGTVSAASLTFTSVNWAAPQTVTVTGVADAVADGNQEYTVVTGPAESDDENYSGLNPDDVTITNVDGQSPGITVAPLDGLVTSETGDSDTFTVVLNMKPTADVTIPLVTGDDTEGTVDPASVTFTVDNWDAPQTVTVAGVDDDAADGAQAYTVSTEPAESEDAGYDTLDADDVAVSNTDNDTAGVTVTPTADLVTTEEGGEDTFSLVLTTRPSADVTVSLASTNENEGLVSASGVTFTPENWNAPQEVTVFGVDDDVADGDQVYAVATGAAASDDAAYDGLVVANVLVTNTDNDSPGVTVSPVSGLETNEDGAEDSFTVVLNAAPTSDVVLALSSSDQSEGTVSPSSLTFTVDNWDAPHTVTVTGVNDDSADGDQVFTIVTAALSSSDAGYDGFNPSDVSATNIDNDSPGITVSPTAGLETTEAGAEDTFTVVLNSAPAANVVIALSSSDVGEGTVSPSSLTFTSANWDAPQTVTVTGVSDLVADGNQVYSIVTAAAVSTDAGYSGLNADDVSASNTDDDSPGITIEPTSGLTTSESGADDTFTVVLNSEPTASVTIALSSSDTAEGTVSPASVTFTTVNWNAPQTVTVTGVNDDVADGSQEYSVVTAAAVSDDDGYDTLNASNVTVTNTDNDSPGITVTPTTGLTTTEAGGEATFTVVLNSEPTASVSVGISSSDTGEGTVSTSSLTFTTANWNAAQTVTVTGVNDDTADGSQGYSIVTAAAVSSDAGYNALNASNVSVTNTDNDSPGVTVTPTSGLTTTEAGGTATFTVVLNSQPTADVVIGVTSQDSTEGVASPSSLTFTSANWDSAQTVTVTGVNDDLADGSQSYAVSVTAAVSSDAGYNGINPSNPSLTNTDNDTPGFTLSATSGLVTTEGLGQATFTIMLNSEPTASVAIGITSSDLTEGTVSTSTVTFTTVNWNAPQTVTVTGVDDGSVDGNQAYTIVTAAATSSDTGYNGLDPSNVSVSNTDNDAGILVSPTSGLTTTENGTQTTFTVVLNTAPSASVVIGVTSSDTTEGTVGPASLTFTTVNWASPQTVTVTGVNDDLADGSQAYNIVTAAAVSSDGSYSGLDADNVSVSNTDNDSPGFTVTPSTGTTTEVGGQATFTVVLNAEPTASVSVAVSSSDTGEGTVSPAGLTFTTVNWNSPQSVTATGVDDLIADGNQAYSVVLAAAVSADGGYSGLNPSDVSLTNTDNETAGITVSPTSGLVTTESGGSDGFNVVLTSEPTADVVIAISSSNTAEGTVSPASLTFTSVNWNAPQSVTVTGVDDDVEDGGAVYTIVTAAATSADSGYNGLNAANVAATNTDDDSAGITVMPTSGLITTEAGGQDSFGVGLNSQPTADVVIAITSSDTTEGTVSPSTLTFTSVNWNAPQFVTVTGVNDDVQDGGQPFTIVTGAASSSDGNYNGLDPSNVTASNTDNDTAGVTVTVAANPLVTTEAGGDVSFTIVLNSEPTADVTISLTSSDTTEGTVDPASVTFTTANWDSAKVVTLTGVNDLVQDGNQAYSIVTGAAVSVDPNYNGAVVADVSMSNTDNDTAGITVTPTSGLTTTEAGGQTTFTVVLNSEPTASVSIGITSSDLTEGTVDASTLTFTTGNWNVAQTVTVTGANDLVQDGGIPYTIVTAAASSADGNYNNLNASNVSVTNTDNDTAGITVSETSGLFTDENGVQDSFTVVLNSQPTANVEIAVASSNTAEGTVSTALLTFTVANYNQPQTVTITGVNDGSSDGTIAYTVTLAAAVSADGNYNGIDPSNVSVVNFDND